MRGEVQQRVTVVPGHGEYDSGLRDCRRAARAPVREQSRGTADPAHPRQLGSFPAGGGPANAVAFSPDGHTLASGSKDARSGSGT